jgi:DNA-binding NarL/FixJ family response regulator
MKTDTQTDKILKVLLIEDEPDECAAIGRVIDNTSGIRLVGITNSIEKAFSDVKDCLPDAVILDIELQKGEGDGINFMERLAAADVVRPFVLVTTGNTSKLIQERVRELGADFIISKSQEKYSAEYVVNFLMSMKSSAYAKIIVKYIKKPCHNRLVFCSEHTRFGIAVIAVIVGEEFVNR